MTPVALGSALVSWSGSMFEYLMPVLVMHSPPESLLDQTYRLVVRRQMSYGTERGIPWGISESAYNVRDLDLTYQYSNFGVPGLGLERGLSEDLVVAPYATVAGRHGRSRGRCPQPVAPSRNRRAGFLRVLRGARLHEITPPRGELGGNRPHLHGASPGHGHRGAGERPAGWRDARALPSRTDRTGHRSALAGTRARGRGGRSAPRGRSARRGPMSPISWSQFSVSTRPRTTWPHAPTCSPMGDTW